MRFAAFAICGLLLPSTGKADQSVLHLRIGDAARSDTEVPLVLDGITDTRVGELIEPRELASRLADAGMLLIGENHTNTDFHRAQFQAIQALHEAGREVLIGLEMFPYTQQASLDAWTDGLYTEDGFVELAKWYEYWGYDWSYYRDIFVYARNNGIRMYGVNTPRDVVKTVRKKGFKELTPEEAAHVPTEVDVDDEDHRRLYRAFFEDDDALHGVLDDAVFEGMFRAQCTWDATMGWNALQALKQHGGSDAIMVVLIGAGHVTYGLGVERQTQPHFDGRIASVIPVPVVDDAGAPVESVRASYADFIWGVPEQLEPLRPVLGVSLMGKVGSEPTQIIRVDKKSVGERAGLRVGDVLVSLDDNTIGSAVHLRRAMSHYQWGDVPGLVIRRDGKTIELKVPLRRRSQVTDE